MGENGVTQLTFHGQIVPTFSGHFEIKYTPATGRAKLAISDVDRGVGIAELDISDLRSLANELYFVASELDKASERGESNEN